MMDLATFFDDLLHGEGFQPYRTEYGNIGFKFEGRTYYVVLDRDDPHYFYMLYPGFWELDPSELDEALRRANDLTRDKKVVKVFLTSDNRHVSASAEQFITDLESVRGTFGRALQALQSVGREFVGQMRQSADERARALARQLAQRRIEAAFGAADATALARLLTDDYTNQDPACPPDGWPPGPEGFGAYRAVYQEAFTGLTLTIASQVSEAERVATVWSVTGTQVGPFMGYSPSYQQVTLRGASIDRIQGHKIAETLTILDTTDLQRQRDLAGPQREDE